MPKSNFFSVVPSAKNGSKREERDALLTPLLSADSVHTADTNADLCQQLRDAIATIDEALKSDPKNAVYLQSKTTMAAALAELVKAMSQQVARQYL